jgi:hypothetical protein
MAMKDLLLKAGSERKAKSKKRTKAGKVMSEFKHGTLHSGSKRGPKVTNRKQAVAIAMSEQRRSGGGY